MREDGCPGWVVAVGTRHRREAGELMPCHPALRKAAARCNALKKQATPEGPQKPDFWPDTGT